MRDLEIEWSEYMLHRVAMRGFSLAGIESIVRHSSERYIDHSTGRLIAVGRDGGRLAMVPYEVESGVIRPVTAHATTRQQIDARLRSGRYTHG